MVNYFELYGLPVSFRPDPGQVKKKFYELSRQFHPDRFAQGGAEAVQEAIRMSALNNEAYRVLKDEDATLKFVLKFYGVLEEEEKYSLPPEFLMEMMELNESVSELEIEQEDAALKASVSKAIQDHLNQWSAEVEPLFAQFHATEPDKDLLLKIKDYYFRKKYLKRIEGRARKPGE